MDTYIKDPQAVLDFTIDWSGWLASGDAISTSTWSAGTGITIDSSSATGTAATVWLSGGTGGTVYEVTNHIVTTAGRADDRTLRIVVAQR